MSDDFSASTSWLDVGRRVGQLRRITWLKPRVEASKNLPLLIILLCVVAGCFTIQRQHENPRGPSLISSPKKISAAPSAISGEDQTSDLKAVFDLRHEQYQSMATDVKTMLYLSLLGVALSAYYIAAKPSILKIPVLDYEINAEWIRWAAPSVLTYIWMHFGYALYSAVKSRAFLLELGGYLENKLPLIADQKPIKYAIEDGGFGDFIFYIYSPHYVTSPGNFYFSWFVVLTTYCALLACCHGLIFYFSTDIKFLKPRGWRQWLRYIQLFVCLVIMVFSHNAFTEMLPDLIILQIYILIVGGGVGCLLSLKNKTT